MQILRQVHRARTLPLPEETLADAFHAWEVALTSLRDEGRLLTASLHRDAYSLFLYTEALGEPLSPDLVLAPEGEPEGSVDDDRALSVLLPWPELDGDPFWVPMEDVFHFNAPASLEHWRRPAEPDRREGRISRLRPGMIASYIYWHYQLQEERAFLGEKYKFIALHGNLLFLYNELPSTTEAPPLPGKLSTHNTPANWADTRMDQHFIPWDAHTPFSRPIELVFGF